MSVGLALLGVVGLVSGVPAQPQEAPKKVPIVLVVGCLEQAPDQTWIVGDATDPMEHIGKSKPPLADADAAKLTGTNRYRLIGVGEFNLPSHKGHRERVEGLIIAAKPMSRINVTSVKHLADTCAKQ